MNDGGRIAYQADDDQYLNEVEEAGKGEEETERAGENEKWGMKGSP